MVRGLASRISSAHVIALIALVVTLAGGAYAFSGSGTLQKAGVTGVSSASFQSIRTLNGFGTLQAQCDTAGDQFEYRLDNTTSTTIRIFSADEASGLSSIIVGPGNQSSVFQSGSTEGSLRIHLFKDLGNTASKSGVEMVVSNDGPFANNCTTADVRVMALNTVE